MKGSTIAPGTKKTLKELGKIAFPAYNGRKFNISSSPLVFYPTWTRLYAHIDLNTFETSELDMVSKGLFDHPLTGQKTKVPLGHVIVVWEHFGAHDLGLTFYFAEQSTLY